MKQKKKQSSHKIIIIFYCTLLKYVYSILLNIEHNIIITYYYTILALHLSWLYLEDNYKGENILIQHVQLPKEKYVPTGSIKCSV